MYYSNLIVGLKIQSHILQLIFQKTQFEFQRQCNKHFIKFPNFNLAHQIMYSIFNKKINLFQFVDTKIQMIATVFTVKLPMAQILMTNLRLLSNSKMEGATMPTFKELNTKGVQRQYEMTNTFVRTKKARDTKVVKKQPSMTTK